MLVCCAQPSEPKTEARSKAVVTIPFMMYGLSSDAGTMSFQCNITNDYFYFRFVAFVNCDIAQAGGVADGKTSGRTPKQRERLSMIARRHGIAPLGTTLVVTLGLILLLTACSKLPKWP